MQSLNISWFFIIRVFVFRSSNFGLGRKFEFSSCGCVWFGGVGFFTFCVIIRGFKLRSQLRVADT